MTTKKRRVLALTRAEGGVVNRAVSSVSVGNGDLVSVTEQKLGRWCEKAEEGYVNELIVVGEARYVSVFLVHALH